jgi:hypothetical protein
MLYYFLHNRHHLLFFYGMHTYTKVHTYIYINIYCAHTHIYIERENNIYFSLFSIKNFFS